MRTAFYAIVGRPNVGKSCLTNAMTGEKVAIVSSKPQTTRNRVTGILTEGEDQFVFLDTPGLHKAKNRLGDYMMKTISTTMAEVDAAILVIEPLSKVGPAEKEIMRRLKDLELPAILAINKIDRYNANQIGDTILAYSAEFDFAAVVPVSAQTGKNVKELIEEARQFMHDGEWGFDADDFTDQPERQLASEMVREKILRCCNEEIPHGVAVVIEDFTEEENKLNIRAVIHCEKESHKSILIGKNGEMLKKIGTYAREDMEKLFGCHVYLDLWVKVKENWRDSVTVLNSFGYNPKDLE